MTMPSPDIIAPMVDLNKVMVIQPTYPLTAGLSSSQLRSAVLTALDKLESVALPPDWIEEEILDKRDWPDLKSALYSAHHPQDEDDLQTSSSARSRLSYDEFLASHLVLALRRYSARGPARSASPENGGTDGYGSDEAIPLSVETLKLEGHDHADGKSSLPRSVVERGLVNEGTRRMPFDLTDDQRKALDEITEDMKRGTEDGNTLRMFRLLQGDVGSGKTAVAFLAMLKAAEQGSQSCLLAPTEVLATQHLQTMRKMADGLVVPHTQGVSRDFRVELLTGGVKGKARQKLLEDVGGGEVDILVATHAVLASAATAFRDFGLAVVDEEQRFGVEQRERLTAFAQHVLYLSATPIPRSLTLALYGDMEVSQLRQMPEGSGEIETTLIPADKAGAIIERLKSRESADDKVFWVLPQIKKSESGYRQHLTSASERYDALTKELGEERVLLLHGRMTSEEKNKTLTEFATADTGSGLHVLVSTSIIEVGVDVPRAGVCVVENAEMFGLSQLHQIRGRLGRTDSGKHAACPASEGVERVNGSGPAQDSDVGTARKKQVSHCILLYGVDVGEEASERLKAIRATRDGFALAERDLQLRGPGEVLGVRQKGYLDGRYKVADLAQQGDIADDAFNQARRLVDMWTGQRRAGPSIHAPGSLDNRRGVDESGLSPLSTLSEEVDGAEEQGARPEDLSVLLTMCGRNDDETGNFMDEMLSRTPLWREDGEPADGNRATHGSKHSAQVDQFAASDNASKQLSAAADSAHIVDPRSSPSVMSPPSGAKHDGAEEDEAERASSRVPDTLREDIADDNVTALVDRGSGSDTEDSRSLNLVRRANLTSQSHRIVLVDVETTGVAHKSDRVIQLAAKVLGSDDPRDCFTSFVDPEGAFLPSGIQELTGITPAILASSNARSFREVWPDFASWLSDVSGSAREDELEGIVLVAHNAGFDHKFLIQELLRGGFDRFVLGELGIVSMVDSLVVLRDRSLWRQSGRDWDMPQRPGSFNLGKLYMHLYGQTMPGAHNALGDIRGLESVLSAPGIRERWREVATRHPTGQIPVPRSVAELQASLEVTSKKTRKSPTKKPPSTRRRAYSRRDWY